MQRQGFGVEAGIIQEPVLVLWLRAVLTAEMRDIKRLEKLFADEKEEEAIKRHTYTHSLPVYLSEGHLISKIPYNLPGKPKKIRKSLRNPEISRKPQESSILANVKFAVIFY